MCAASTKPHRGIPVVQKLLKWTISHSVRSDSCGKLPYLFLSPYNFTVRDVVSCARYPLNTVFSLYPVLWLTDTLSLCKDKL